MQHNAAPGPAQNGQRAALDAHRAAVLREAADVVGNDDDCECGGCDTCLPRKLADELRRLADEAATEKATPTGEATPADLTVYRASHDSIVMGLYTTAAEARKHCEAAERDAWDTPPTFAWTQDGEFGDAELTAWIGGKETETGYVVTALTVASKFDEEADA
jgi:hypothetical protein